MLRKIYGVTVRGDLRMFDTEVQGSGHSGRDGIQHAWLYFDNREDAATAGQFIKFVDHLKDQLDEAMKQVLKIGPECDSSVVALRADFTASAVAFVEQFAAVQSSALEQVERDDVMQALAAQRSELYDDGASGEDVAF